MSDGAFRKKKTHQLVGVFVSQDVAVITTYYIRFVVCYVPLLGPLGAAALYLSVRFDEEILYSHDLVGSE